MSDTDHNLKRCPKCSSTEISLFSLTADYPNDNEYRGCKVICANCGTSGPASIIEYLGGGEYLFSAEEKIRVESEAVQKWNKPPRNNGWQPIESAPRDGSYILVSGIGILSSNGMYVCEAYGGANGFYTSQGLLGNQPKYWMPLPAPPEAA